MIEILIVLAILAMCIGVIGFNTFKAVREQRFQTEVSQVVDDLRLAQNLMLIMNTDSRMKFTSEDKLIKYWLEFDQQLVKNWGRELQREPKTLKYIQFVNFQDELNKEHVVGSAEVRFLSGGSVMSRGVMRLSTSINDDARGALVRYVHLPGYPSAIVSTENAKEKADELDEGLTDIITQEIMSDGQPQGGTDANP